jgi:hypothetical protein
LEASERVTATLSPSHVVFLTPVVPSLEPGRFYDQLLEAGWQPQCLNGEPLVSRALGKESECQGKRIQSWLAAKGDTPVLDTPVLRFGKASAVLLLLKGGFSDTGRWAEAGIAMAGTGTEQLVSRNLFFVLSES